MFIQDGDRTHDLLYMNRILIKRAIGPVYLLYYKPAFIKEISLQTRFSSKIPSVNKNVDQQPHLKMYYDNKTYYILQCNEP